MLPSSSEQVLDDDLEAGDSWVTLLMSSLALFSADQPTTEGKHQNTGAELQHLSDVVDSKAGQ